MSDPNINHPVSLKVMRLSRPFFAPQTPLQKVMCKPSPDDDLLMLPSAFGTIRLGETFQCYLCVNNDTTTTVLGVTFKVELHTNAVKNTLYDTTLQPENLLPNQTIETCVTTEIKEIGVHILICTVGYGQSKFKKFYKFSSVNPIAVKTKVNAFGTVQFLEAQLQNLSASPVLVERVKFEQSPECLSVYDVTDLSIVDDVYLNAGDIRQHLFRFDQKPSVMLNEVKQLGKIDILWRTAMCEPGRLQTGQLLRKFDRSSSQSQSDGISASFTMQGQATAQKPFTIEVTLTNDSNREINSPVVQVDKSKLGSLLIQGPSVLYSSKDPLTTTISFGVTLIALQGGCLTIDGLVLVDQQTTRQIYLDIGQVLVSS